MPRLTKRLVDAAQPRSEEYLIWDDEISGFGLRVMPSGRKTFLLKYRVGGGRSATMRKPTIGVYGTVTPDEARTIAKKWMAEIINGGDPSGERKSSRLAPTVSNLLDRFLSEYSLPRNQPSTYAKNKRLIETKIKPALGSLKVNDVTPRNIAAFQHRHSDTPIEANRCLALLSTAFKLAAVWGLRTGENPVRGISKFRESARDRVLSVAELGRLGAALSDLEDSGSNLYGITAIRLAAPTGWRIGEILSLKWNNVDLELLEASVSGKTGKRSAAISAPVASLISGLPRFGDFVFPGRNKDKHLDYAVVRRIWASACMNAGIEDARIHDLRHGAATTGARLGASAHILRDLLGHRTLAMSNRYVARLLDPVRDISEKVGIEIAESLARRDRDMG